jgi:hypothetical protein
VGAVSDEDEALDLPPWQDGLLEWIIPAVLNGERIVINTPPTYPRSRLGKETTA